MDQKVTALDAIQVELNMNGIRDTEENRSVFSKNFADIIIIFLKTYYVSEIKCLSS